MRSKWEYNWVSQKEQLLYSLPSSAGFTADITSNSSLSQALRLEESNFQPRVGIQTLGTSTAVLAVKMSKYFYTDYQVPWAPQVLWLSGALTGHYQGLPFFILGHMDASLSGVVLLFWYNPLIPHSNGSDLELWVNGNRQFVLPGMYFDNYLYLHLGILPVPWVPGACWGTCCLEIAFGLLLGHGLCL